MGYVPALHNYYIMMARVCSVTRNSSYEYSLWALMAVLSHLWDHPQTSVDEKVKETEAPTLQTALQEAKQTIKGQKTEIAALKEWVKEDRDFLWERLEEALAVRSNKGIPV
ncbi:hypothetical protein UPYG_G00257800 [Umbra pygmaea]|uniref:Uncharacterized protein n=1 Tax=Umbra pygmaea TaxID=75934 RepID=A0ABD0W8P8_UMBPY